MRDTSPSLLNSHHIDIGKRWRGYFPHGEGPHVITRYKIGEEDVCVQQSLYFDCFENKLKKLFEIISTNNYVWNGKKLISTSNNMGDLGLIAPRFTEKKFLDFSQI